MRTVIAAILALLALGASPAGAQEPQARRIAAMTHAIHWHAASHKGAFILDTLSMQRDGISTEELTALQQQLRGVVRLGDSASSCGKETNYPECAGVIHVSHSLHRTTSVVYVLTWYPGVCGNSGAQYSIRFGKNLPEALTVDFTEHAHCGGR